MNSYYFYSDSLPKTTAPMHETARYKSQQAVIERGSDAKTVERRGAV
jgi:hypothetical protein